MKNLFLSFILFCFSFCVVGQIMDRNQNSYVKELPNIVPPSPQAYSLGSYGDVNVGYFTGTIQPSIPLLNYSVGGINVPISLSYQSNGIKVDQTDGSAGLGWNFNVGGVINRTIVGSADELRQSQIPKSIIGNYNSDEATKYFQKFTYPESEYIDVSLDIYSYSFMGKSGKFVIDRITEMKSEIVNLTANGIRIS